MLLVVAESVEHHLGCWADSSCVILVAVDEFGLFVDLLFQGFDMDPCNLDAVVELRWEFLVDILVGRTALTFDFAEVLELGLESLLVEDQFFVDNSVIFHHNLGFHCYS